MDPFFIYHERFERLDLLREREREDQSLESCDDLDFRSVDTSFFDFDRERDFERRFRERDRDLLLLERLLLRERRPRE